MTTLTPTEKSIYENMQVFVKAGNNTTPLTRRDAVVLCNLFKRLEADAVRIEFKKPARVCFHCEKVETDANPLCVAVTGKGLLHGACADALGYRWRHAKPQTTQGRLS